MQQCNESLVGLSFRNGDFTIQQYITGGSFGAFYLGTANRGPEGLGSKRVGIKVEKKDAPQAQLFLEYGFYRALGSVRFIPQIFGFDSINADWHALVMELLGPSLLNMNVKCGHRFSIQTTTQLMVQLLTVFEYIHERAIIYRDIKPENFLFGPPNTDKWCTVMLIDLGFCKKIVDGENRHIAYRTGKPITGTHRYISVNNHGGCELGRRDDLEALLYMIVFLHKGQLPWQGLPAGLTIIERLMEVGKIKRDISAAELCRGMPSQFAAFLATVKQLPFEQRPAYEEMRATFYQALFQMGVLMGEEKYDWNKAHELSGGDSLAGQSQQQQQQQQ